MECLVGQRLTARLLAFEPFFVGPNVQECNLRGKIKIKINGVSFIAQHISAMVYDYFVLYGCFSYAKLYRFMH